jgi:lysophospholipase L1-like esterase
MLRLSHGALTLACILSGCTGQLSAASSEPDASLHDDGGDGELSRDAGLSDSRDAAVARDGGTFEPASDAGQQLEDAGPPPAPLIVSYTSSGAVRGSNADLGALNIGNQFSVTRAGIVLRELGVFDQGSDGLARAHTVTVFKLDRLGAGAAATPVEGASVSVPAGAEQPFQDGFRFAALAAPVALEPGAYSAIAYGMDGADAYGEGGNLPATISGIEDAARSDWQFVVADSPAYPTGGADVALPSVSFRFQNGGPAPLRVLCMGDSITWGWAGNDAGYRRMLHDQLDAAGVAHQLVGTDAENQGALPRDQLRHEGHPGWTIEAGTSGRDGLLDHVADWLGPNGAHPDAILLMIGTNDVDLYYDLEHAEERLERLVTRLLDAATGLAPGARLVLAKLVINGNPDKDANVVVFNGAVERIAMRHRDAGEDVRVVDMHGALAYPADFADGLHPNDQGYQKMAQVWFDALLAP